jgi:hypothetical protein
MNPGIEAVEELAKLGYVFHVVKAIEIGGRFNHPQSHHLLDVIEAHKPQVIKYLRKKAKTPPKTFKLIRVGDLLKMRFLLL